MIVSDLLEQPCNKSDNATKLVTSCFNNLEKQFVPILLQETMNKQCEHNLLTTCQGPRKIGNWEGPYSYIRVHKPWEQSISKEINEAESEHMNMGPPQLPMFRGPCLWTEL